MTTSSEVRRETKTAGGVSFTEGLATAIFLWALLATTYDNFVFVGEDISRTRELTTAYAALAVAVVASPWRAWPSHLKAVVACFAGSISVGFVVWEVQEGSFVASNYWSQWVMALGLLMLGLAFGRRVWWLWRRILIAYALLVALIQSVMLVVGPARYEPPAGPADFYLDRPISAALSLLMVFALVMTFSEKGLAPVSRNVVAGVLGASVVLAQHRSAWLALLLALGMLVSEFVVRRVPIHEWWGVVASGSFFLLAAVLPLATGASLLPGSGSQGTDLPDSFESVGTMRWRLDMWWSRLTEERSAIDWLTGGTFGKTPAWGPDSTVINASISGHSMAIDLLTMLGVLGLTCFVALVIIGVTGSGTILAEMPTVVVSALGFGVFYAWPPWCWLLLGVAVAVAVHGASGREPT